MREQPQLAADQVIADNGIPSLNNLSQIARFLEFGVRCSVFGAVHRQSQILHLLRRDYGRLGAGCCRLKVRDQWYPSHHTIPQHGFLIDRFFQENLERVSRIEYAYWSRVPVRDRNVFQAPLLHSCPDVVQQVARLTEKNVACHH